MSMGAGSDSSGFNSEINVTPMVDIMLVLLIIFMVVTPMLQHGVTVNLPKDLNNPDYLGKDEVKQDQVKDKVEKMLANIKKEEDKVVYIKSGVGVSYGDVVNIINEVRALGVDKIGLVADKRKGDGAPAKPA
jgi:biopolymer transport protein TolR